MFSENKVRTDCTVTYRATGIKWSAVYSISLNRGETRADFSSWITIDNQSGKKYDNTYLKLIAGNVNRVEEKNAGLKSNLKSDRSYYSPSFSEKSFADYIMYTLSSPVTIDSSSQKQI